MSQRFKLIVAAAQDGQLQNPRQLEYADRGFQYGDGCFTTMYCEKNRIALFNAHITRLVQDAGRLKINLNEIKLREQIKAALIPHLTDNTKTLAIKLIVTRGTGGRGYEPPKDAIHHIYISFHECAQFTFAQTSHHQQTHYTLRPCSFPLASQALLAGIKHLNRLEQVLAKHELQTLNSQQHCFDDLLMLDAERNIVECTAGNIFFFVNNAWHTPALDMAGVAGVMRAAIIHYMHSQSIEINIRVCTVEELLKAESIFICNSLKHFIPVNQFTALIGGEKRHSRANNAKADELFVGLSVYLADQYTRFQASNLSERP